jgi:D-psicose/D-tagatose/L-ribulose 3-epimerase
MHERKYRFGAHQFMWKSHWTDADLSILDTVSGLGLSLFEISLGDDVDFDLKATGKAAASLGIELTAGPGNLWPRDRDISSEDEKYRRAGIEWHKGLIARAAEMGAVAYCGAIYGHPGRVERRRPPADELPRVAEGLHELAEHASSLGIRLVIEPMSRFRTHIVNTALQALQLARLASSPAILVNLDTFHMVTEERDYGAALRAVMPRLWGIHACESDRGVPGGGLVPWPQVFRALDESERPVRVLFETYNTGPGDFGFSRGVFKDLCPDPERFVAQGLTFIKGCIGTRIE